MSCVEDNEREMEEEEEDEIVEVNLEKPVPSSLLEQVMEEKQQFLYLKSMYRQAGHQPLSLHQWAPSTGDSGGAVREESGVVPPASAVQQLPSLTHSRVSSGGSRSYGLPLRHSGTASIEEVDGLGSRDCQEDLLSLEPSPDTVVKINASLQQRYQAKLLDLENILKKNLAKQAEVKKKIKHYKNMSDQAEDSEIVGKHPLRISFFCMPYFKNRSGMNAPMNEDAKYKVDNGYINLYTSQSRGWVNHERETLVEEVLNHWKKSSLKKMDSDLKDLLRKQRNLGPDSIYNVRKSLEFQLKHLQARIKNMEETSYEDLVPEPWASMDWEMIAAQAFDGHRSSEECRLQWENYLHPFINCDSFSESEDLAIQTMVRNGDSEHPNWEAIALKLNTSRTPFMVAQRWLSFISPTVNPAKWSPQETQKLMDTVNMLRIGQHIPWAKVHQHMTGYSRPQIQSHWRLINPESCKGPFSVEEDFIFIKGLHVFGFNFANITHFMPGRHAYQVKIRFRRTIQPGLADKPWTRQEDEILVKYGKVGSRNWRQLIWHLPTRTACEIRCRYHTLAVWQSVSKTTMSPPPLFPVSLTVDPVQIKEIRKHMIEDHPKTREVVERSRKNISVVGVVQELENRRVQIAARKAEKSAEKIKRLTERRGRRPGVCVLHHLTLQDEFLDDFFTPCRPGPLPNSFTFESYRDSLVSMCQVMQLSLAEEVTPSEQQMAQQLFLGPQDMEVVHQFVAQHNHPQHQQPPVVSCEGCSSVQPHAIPLLPPSQTTIGTLKSVLLHRPKLLTMASGDFLFYKLSKPEWLALGPDPKQISSTCIPQLSLVNKLTEISDSGDDPEHSPASAVPQVVWRADAVLGSSAGSSTATPSTSNAQEKEDGPSEAAAPGLKQFPLKFHITSMVNQEKEKRTMQNKAGPKRRTRRGRRRKTCANYHQHTHGGGLFLPPQQQDQPAARGAALGFRDSSSTLEPPTKRCRLDRAKQKAEREKADHLLFHRMLAILYWPAIMTQEHPPKECMKEVTKKVEEFNKTQEATPKMQAQKPKKKFMLTKDDLKTEEMEDYIQEMLRENQRCHAVLNNKKLHKAKATTSKDADTEEQSEGEQEGSDCIDEGSHTPDQPSDQCRPSQPREQVGVRKKVKKAGHTAMTQEEEEEEKVVPEPMTEEVADEAVTNHTAGQIMRMRCRKTNLISLRRSFMMKKIWAGRRCGTVANRTRLREKRCYDPRPSRTRDSVRRDRRKPTPAPNSSGLSLPGLKVLPMEPLDCKTLLKVVEGKVEEKGKADQASTN